MAAGNGMTVAEAAAATGAAATVSPAVTGAGAPAAVITDPTTGMRFVGIKGGCYQMGDTFGEGARDEKPAHEVCVQDFALAQHDVTVGEFRRFVRSTGYLTEAEKGGGCAFWGGESWLYDAKRTWMNPGFEQDDRHPVVCVSWNDATAFIAWLEKSSGRHYRLPTEAEWEYAARTGGKQERYAGFSEDEELGRHANFCDSNCDFRWKRAGQDDHYRNTSPVGSYQPNGLGLYDMSGNVWQWLSDYYERGFYREPVGLNPKGPAAGEKHVLRGGSWTSKPYYLRATNRFRSLPLYRVYDTGFRLAISP
ncbi:formylglycine-generating enzyme family protein [Geomonas sp.]|uniref:formylglycine-generating enzyme family protein n=1 Tax=Geomonas sp. TaxID=2651584 RepID=UPI002B4A624B|nr:formylglycine-generating enzyme family protein [Geomonas sp.]